MASMAGLLRCIGSLSPDIRLLFATRALRMASYGSVTVVLMLYLQLHMSDTLVGVLLSCISFGDLFISLYLTTRADVFGRKRTLLVGAALKILAGIVFASTAWFPALLIAGIIGVISSTGGEIGPFLSVEQAALTDLCHIAAQSNSHMTVATLFAWYNAMGSLMLAVGALISGWCVHIAVDVMGWENVSAYRLVFLVYALFAVVNMLLYSRLSRNIEPEVSPPVPVGSSATSSFADDVDAAPAVTELPTLRRRLRTCFHCGLKRPESRKVVARLAALFLVDAFAGALVMQTVLVSWFHEVWGLGTGTLGSMLMGANVVSGISGVISGYLVQRIGAIATMVYTHLPSNVLLGLIPLMPSAPSAVVLLIVRFCISQMDVPARQAYVAMVVKSDERSAAGGITNIVRSLGASLAPLPLGVMLATGPGSGWYSAPFYVSALMKIAYDIAVYISFRAADTKGTPVAQAAVTPAPKEFDEDRESEGGLPVPDEDQEETAPLVHPDAEPPSILTQNEGFRNEDAV